MDKSIIIPYVISPDLIPDDGRPHLPERGWVMEMDGKFRCRVVIDGVTYIHPLQFDTKEEAGKFLDITMSEGAIVTK